jgi:hypothetical protein
MNTFLPPLASAETVWLGGHWFRLLLLLAGLLLVVLAAVLRRRTVLAWSLGAPGAILALLGLGGLIFPAPAGGFFAGTAGWLLVVGAGLIVVVAALLLMIGFWNRYLALLAPVPLLLGLGGFLLGQSEYAVADLAQTITEMRIKSPWWLLLLAVIPFVVLLGARRLNRQEVRPWLALGLRVLGIAALALALAEPFFSQATRAMTVLFVVDRSLSIPEEPEEDPNQPGVRIDKRSERVRKFINDSVQMRGTGHERDQAGLIVFGRSPLLDLQPSDAPRFNLQKLPAIDDGTYTDIQAALRLALASFPEGTARRIVLISDGNENLGDAREEARLAKTLGVQIDVLPLGSGKRNENEVLVERVDAPPIIEQGARVPIRVLVRSHNPNVVIGRLTLRQITDKEGTVTIVLGKQGELGVDVKAVEAGEPPPEKATRGVRITAVTRGSPAGRAGLEPGEEITHLDGAAINDPVDLNTALLKKKAGQAIKLTMRRNPVRVVAVKDPVRLIKGLNPFSFDRPLTDEQRSYTYEAEFQPLRVVDEKGRKLLDGLPGDRVENNRASAHVVARGQGRVLLLEGEAGQHRELVEKLVEAGKGRFKVIAEPATILGNYRERDKLAVFLSNFDCVILANVPAELIPPDQQEVIRSNTHDQGCGLVMIGGPESYGAGGWQNLPVEQALPVDAEIKSLKVQGKGGLVLIMHACEMADGNRWERKIARLAADRLGPADEIGVLEWGFTGFKWVIPMMEVGPNKQRIVSAIDKMVPSDMPDFDPALKLAHTALTDKKKDFAVKHIIIISDGDPQQNDKKLLKQIRDDKITIACVGVATHGGITDANFASIASKHKNGKPRFYKVDDPKKLPAIYIKETRLVSQSFVHKVEFMPRLVYRSGPTQKLPDLLPLRGYVRTTPKNSPLVEVPIVTPKFADTEFPILAHWHYGLGKSVAFTSDAGRPEFWSQAWLRPPDGREGIFAGFWEQVVGWALRPVESGRLVMNTEYRDGKIKVVVEARTQDGKPDTSLRLRGGLTTPGGKLGEAGKKQELRFVQKNSGMYEAEVKADEAGSYFLNAQATRVRKIKTPDGKEREIEEGTDSVRSGVTLPYSPEFTDLESNTPLLEEIARMTGGKEYVDDSDLLTEEAKKGSVFRSPVERSRFSLPFHYWLLLLAATLLLLDVAVRRLAFSPEETAAQAKYVWARLRGFPVPPPVQREAVLRLRARPGVLTTAGDRGTRRFEGGPAYALPGGIDATDPTRPLTPPRPAAVRAEELGPQPEAPAQAGGLENLMEAKKRVWDERKKDRPDEG